MTSLSLFPPSEQTNVASSEPSPAVVEESDVPPLGPKTLWGSYLIFRVYTSRFSMTTMMQHRHQVVHLLLTWAGRCYRISKAMLSSPSLVSSGRVAVSVFPPLPVFDTHSTSCMLHSITTLPIPTNASATSRVSPNWPLPYTQNLQCFNVTCIGLALFFFLPLTSCTGQGCLIMCVSSVGDPPASISVQRERKLRCLPCCPRNLFSTAHCSCDLAPIPACVFQMLLELAWFSRLPGLVVGPTYLRCNPYLLRSFVNSAYSYPMDGRHLLFELLPLLPISFTYSNYVVLRPGSGNIRVFAPVGSVPSLSEGGA